MEADLVSKYETISPAHSAPERKEKIMAFGPIMRFAVGTLSVELAPLTKDSVGEFVNSEYGGGLQQRTVSRYLGMTWAPTVEDEQEWFDKIRTDKSCLVWGIWLIEGQGDERKRTLIGNSALTGIDEGGHTRLVRQATSGSLIFRKEYWGKGIASAAHKARTWYAFEQLGLHRIKSAVIQANGGSRKALERSGYTLVYSKRNEQFSDGQFHHLDCLECLNPRDLFWNQWWHGDRPAKTSREARSLTKEALSWAEENVELA